MLIKVAQHIRSTLQDLPPLGVREQSDGRFLMRARLGSPCVSAFLTRYLYFVSPLIVAVQPFPVFGKHRAQWVAFFTCQEFFLEYSWAVLGKVNANNKRRVCSARKIAPFVLIGG